MRQNRGPREKYQRQSRTSDVLYISLVKRMTVSCIKWQASSAILASAINARYCAVPEGKTENDNNTS